MLEAVKHPYCALVGMLAVAFFARPPRSQSSVTRKPETPPGDRSFYVNQPVDHPEALSGVWQTSDGQGPSWDATPRPDEGPARR